MGEVPDAGEEVGGGGKEGGIEIPPSSFAAAPGKKGRGEGKKEGGKRERGMGHKAPSSSSSSSSSVRRWAASLYEEKESDNFHSCFLDKK